MQSVTRIVSFVFWGVAPIPRTQAAACMQRGALLVSLDIVESGIQRLRTAQAGWRMSQ